MAGRKKHKVYKIIHFKDPYNRQSDYFLADFIEAEGIQSAKRIAEEKGYDLTYYGVYEIPRYIRVIDNCSWVEKPYLEQKEIELKNEINRLEKVLKALQDVKKIIEEERLISKEVVLTSDEKMLQANEKFVEELTHNKEKELQ